MSMKNHVFTPGEEKCLQEYYAKCQKEPRKNLIKMVRHINMLNPFPSNLSWEYVFFDRMLDDEAVDFVLKMKLRTPYYIDALAKRENLTIEKTSEIADRLVHIGILEYTSDDKLVDMVQVPVFDPGAMENTVMRVVDTDRYPETAPAFLNYILDLQKLVANYIPMGQALMRAIPVEAAIKNESKKVKYEEVSYWLDKAGESIAVAQCECRRLRRMVGEGTADLEGEWCIELGKYAESCIRVGKARRITREEAEGILKKAEERGYVHQLSNIDGPDLSLFICNCAWDTCMALKTSWYTQSPALSASNYSATVDKSKCVACGGCVEVCPQNAVKLGEKLCQITPAKIKGTAIPQDTMFFGKSHWQPDFLTDRKIVQPETGTSPCKANCPAHISIQGYLQKAKEGKYDEALQIIKKTNPFPAVCGRVCSKYCEQVCTRGDLDEAVSIDEVKKFIADMDLKDDPYVPAKYNKPSGKRIAVIGAGPAGLSCAYYLAVLGHDVTVFEKERTPGGMMVYGMPSFRLDRKVVAAEIEVIRKLGVTIKTGIEVGKDVTIQSLRNEGFQAFYVAIGAQGGRKLNIPGEDLTNVISGIDFLKKIEESKDKAMLNGNVVIVGGGNVAIDVARTALRGGAKQVTMVCLEQPNEMPSSKDEIEEAKKEGIKIVNGYGPKEILGSGKVSSITFKKCTRVFDESHRFSPLYDESETISLDAEFVLTSIGQSFIYGDLFKGENIEFNKNRAIKADPWTYQTRVKDIFTGGDVYTGPKFAIDAIAAGKEAADSLHRYVHEGHSLTLGRVRPSYSYIDKKNIIIDDYDHGKRQQVEIDKSKSGSFEDDRIAFSEEQVKKETSRCLSCGAAVVDSNICIGCGLCTTRCKFDAISLTKVRNKFSVPYEHLVGAVLKEGVSRVGRQIAKPFKGQK